MLEPGKHGQAADDPRLAVYDVLRYPKSRAACP